MSYKAFCLSPDDPDEPGRCADCGARDLYTCRRQPALLRRVDRLPADPDPTLISQLIETGRAEVER